MSLGRYFSPRDMRLIGSFNGELMADWVQTEAMIFKLSAANTPVNIYGEATGKVGKVFYPGVNATCFIEREDIVTEDKEHGPTRKQNTIFAFRESVLENVNLFPETGDIIMFNNRYHEIFNVEQEQFLGGIADKSWSLVCHTFYSRLSNLNIFQPQ